MNHKEKSIVLFDDKKVRRHWDEDAEEWSFSIIDVVAILTDQPDAQKARKYWNKLAQRLRDEGSEVVTNCHRLKLMAPEGEMHLTDCAKTKGLLHR